MAPSWEVGREESRLTAPCGMLGQAENVVQFPIDEQAGIGGDLAAEEIQLQTAVKSELARALGWFTCWMGHDPPADLMTIL